MNYNNNTPNSAPNGNNETLNPMMGMNQNPGNLNSSIPEIKRRRNMIPVFIIAFFLVLAVGGFITFRVIITSPKRVFETAIKTLYNGISSSLDNVNRITENFDFENKALTMSGDARFDTNSEDSSSVDFKLSDLQIGGGLGLDINNEQATLNLFLKGPKESIEGNTYYTDEKLYADTNLYEDLIYVEGQDVNIDFSSLNDIVKELKSNMVEIEDIDYLVAATTNALAESLDPTYMSKNQEKKEITKGDKTFTKYSYTLSDNAIRDLVNGTLDKLSNDSKFIQIISEFSTSTEDDIKDYINEIKNSTDEIEFENKIVLNIYTQGFLNKFAGLSIDVDNEEVITYIDDTTDFKMTIAAEPNDINVIGSRNDSGTEIEVEYQDTTVLTLTIKEFSKEKVDISFKTDILQELDLSTVGGSIYFTYNEEKTKISGEYKLQVDIDEYYVNVSGNYKFTSSDSLEIPNVKDAVNIKNVDKNTLIDNLKEKANKDEVLNSIVGETIAEYEKPIMPVDAYGMQVIPSIDDLKKIINAKGSSVIYVGDIYPTADGTPAAQLFQDLVSLQTTLDFHSYRLVPFFYDDTTKSLFGNVTSKCDTSPCSDMPIIFFIKDGTIVEHFTPPTSKEHIIQALQSIGIQSNDKI